MTNHNDPVYPFTNEMENTGLSIREAFAMAAMQGFCANPSISTESGNITDGKIAAWSVDMADALIVELNR